MYLLLLYFFSFKALAAPTKEIEEARSSIEALIRPLIPVKGQKKLSKIMSKFRVDGCEKHKIEWLDVLTMRKTVTLEYRFKEGCDIQGTISPRVLQPFHATLQLRNLESYTKVEGQNRLTASIESRPIMYLEIRSGVLSGKKGQVLFEADYQVRINPAKTKDLIEENLGGIIRITEIHGKKVSIKEKIKIE